jgi:hypothetical protein
MKNKTVLLTILLIFIFANSFFIKSIVLAIVLLLITGIFLIESKKQ